MIRFILILMIMLSGCATQQKSEVRLLETPPAMEPIVKSTSATRATGTNGEVMIITPTKMYVEKNYNLLYKSYLPPEEKISDDLVTFIYFPKKPTSEKEISLYKKVCEEWSDTVLSYQEASTHHDNKTENLVPFYWFIKNKHMTPSCDYMIEYYDYARAQQLMRKTKLDIKKAQFVAIYKEYRVTMNVSSLTEDEDIVKAFQGWSTYMTKVPEKNDIVYVFNMVDSLKKVLGALEVLVSTKFKG